MWSRSGASKRRPVSRRQVRVPAPPESAGDADARPRAIQALGEMVEGMLNELMACSEGSELDRASLALVTREKNGKVCCISLIKAGEFADMVKGLLGPMMKEITG